MPSNEIDPRLLARLATNRTSRRRFIGGGAAAAAAVALGGSFLAACGSDSGSPPPARRRRRTRTGQRHAADLELAAVHGRRLRRRLPEGVGPHRGLQGRLQRQRAVVRQGQGTAVTQAGHRRGPGGADHSSWRPDCTASAGSTRSAMPACRTRRTSARTCSRPAWTPAASSARRTCPAWSGWRTTGPPPAATSRDRRPVGSGVQGQGQPVLRCAGRPRHDHAVAGQLGRETRPPRPCRRPSTWSGNRRTRARSAASPATTTPTILAAGNIAVAQAYSGDVVQLQADNPDLQFVVPESGATTGSSTPW